MDLRTYQANSMAEALQKVKKDLGREAVILHTRTVRRGGLLGLGGRTMVEITATRDVNVLHPAERRVVSGRDVGVSRPADAVAPEPAARASRAAASEVTAARVSKPPVVDRAVPEKVPDFTASLRGEVGELREMVRELLSRSAAVNAGAPPNLPEELQQYYTVLVENAVADEIARDVVARASDRLAECRAHGGQRLATISMEQLIPAVLVESIERMLPPAEPVQLDPHGTKYVALVGPTGVGKTTTIAKLAAHFKLRENKRVGMITIDTYRIAAVEQLRAYADILRVPLEIVLTPVEMSAALERMADMDLVLIDTSGRSQRDSSRIGELSAFLDAVREAGGESALEVHLVLSCTGHPAQLVEVAEKFAALGVRRVVFTKLDEAVGLGVILNVVRRVNLQLSYLTTGQDVPDDIEVGHRRRIAELVLDRQPSAQPEQPPNRMTGAAVDQVA